MKTRLDLFLVVVALVSTAASRPAWAGSVRVSVSPNVILADGISTAVVTAEVRTSAGRPARDGTEVRFYTTAGTITQVAFTTSGVARATLTAASVPQAANISVSAGIDQAVIAVPMVSKLVETSVGGRVLRIQGKYVAFSEDKRFIQADEQVKVRFRGLTVEAASAQLDLNENTLKALGKVQVASDDQTLVGERLWVDLRSFEGYVVSVGNRRWFSGYGLTDLPERPRKVNPDFSLEDLTDSKLLWVGKQASYVVGERVQVQGARAYVGGLKSVRMPFHEANLRAGFGETNQYVGVGTEGLTLDVPLYLRMTPESSTALHVGYGARSSGGIGSFSRERGLNVDLVQKYGFSGASEGQAMVTNLASVDRWGLQWNHTQQINKTTRLVANFQFPEHRDLYGHVNLTAGMPVGTVQMSMAANRLHGRNLARTLTFAFETKPRPVADGKVALSAETGFYYRDAQQVRIPRQLTPDGRRARTVSLANTQYQTVGIKARPVPVSLAKGLTLDSSLALRAVSGGPSRGFGPAVETYLRKELARNGFLTLGLSYNGLTSATDFFPSQGRLAASMNVSYLVGSRLRVTGLGSMALDAENRNSLIQLSYQLNPKWRFDVLHSLFRFGEFGDFDYQFGIARALGSRELGIYWSRQEHRFIVEFGAARF